MKESRRLEMKNKNKNKLEEGNVWMWYRTQYHQKQYSKLVRATNKKSWKKFWCPKPQVVGR